jgi:hypothetical protein
MLVSYSIPVSWTSLSTVISSISVHCWSRNWCWTCSGLSGNVIPYNAVALSESTHVGFCTITYAIPCHEATTSRPVFCGTLVRPRCITYSLASANGPANQSRSGLGVETVSHKRGSRQQQQQLSTEHHDLVDHWAVMFDFALVANVIGRRPGMRLRCNRQRRYRSVRLDGLSWCGVSRPDSVQVVRPPRRASRALVVAWWWLARAVGTCRRWGAGMSWWRTRYLAMSATVSVGLQNYERELT